MSSHTQHLPQWGATGRCRVGGAYIMGSWKPAHRPSLA